MMRKNNTSSIWVMIVDDEPIMLSALRTYFSSTSDIRVVAEASDGTEALALLDTVKVDLVLADIHMPEMDGVTLLREIRKMEDPPVFVAVTALDTDDTMLEVLAAGGAGYIVKSSRPQTIISAVRDAVEGGMSVSPYALKRLVGHLPEEKMCGKPPRINPPSTGFSLTVPEKRVLRHLCNGKSNTAIAETLNYSESTVKKQVSNLIAVFGVDSRLSLAVAVIRSGHLDE